jgi:hypothetical protein
MVSVRITPVVRPVMSDTQHGLVKGRSTVSGLVQFTHGVIGEIEYGWQVDGVYTDLSKAFDRVLHGLLKFNLSILFDRLNTTCQVVRLFVRIESMSFQGSTGVTWNQYSSL